jgi:hypothetical protein
MILTGISNASMVQSCRLSQVLLLFIVVIIQKTGGFLCLPGKRQISFNYGSKQHKSIVKNDKCSSFCIHAKRKDNRKYVDKDNEDEVDEEMMEGFSEM